MQIDVTRDVLAALMAEAERAHPHECCGILLGVGTSITAIQPTNNVHPEPARHFEIDPQTLINAHRTARDGGAQVLGYYHSHPASAPEPSAIDQAMAARDGAVWAIIGEGKVTFWQDAPSGFMPLSYAIAEG